MPITIVTGPANAGKAHVLLEAVRAHVAHGDRPLLIVPTEADQARYRRELAEGGLTLGARVERFEGLLSAVVARARLAEAPLGAVARERVLARLAQARPGTAVTLVGFVSELETQRVTPARLRGALNAWSASPAQSRGASTTLERVSEVFDAYHQALAKMGRADLELRITRALDGLRRDPVLWGATPVALYGFDDLTELQLDAIETLGGVVDARVTVSLAYEPGRVAFAGRAGTFQRLAPLADIHTALEPRAEYYALGSRQALHHIERSLLTDDPTRVDPGEAVRLLEGGSPRSELELVAGEVRGLLDAGVRAEEIAIVHRSPDAIAGLLGEVLTGFGVPYAMREHVRFADTAVGRGLLGLMRCALGDGTLGDLLAWLRAPGVLDRPELADRLEARALRQGATGAVHARVLWEAEHWPLERIDRIREQPLPALADALAAELHRLFCAPRRARAAVLGEEELDEGRALVSGRRAFEELRDMARWAPELAPTPSELIEVLERLELAGGASPGSGMVVVADPLSLRARRVRMLFACGLQEGVFPAPATPHPLLGEDERRALAHASGLALRGEPDALAAERYLLYALVSRPEERLTLSWHTASEDGAPLARSLFVDDVCDLFDPTLRSHTVRRFAGAADWPGPGRSAGTMVGREAAIAAAAARRPCPIGPLGDERVLGELRERTLWSASSLESWAGCPVKWFVERLLRAQEIDPTPEPIARGGLAHAALKDTLEQLRERTGSARLTPASVALAKRLLKDALARHEPHHPLSVAPERLPGARRRLQADLERYLQCACEQESPLEPTHLELEFGFAGPGGREADHEHDRHGGDSPPALTAVDPGDGVSPPFPAVDPGDGVTPTLPPVELGDGVLLRGRIDRVDVGEHGEAVVYDYKGRSAPPGAKWASDGAFQIALYMRAAEQLLGYTPVGGFYQPLAGRDMRARGVLDGDSDVELECVRTDLREHGDFDELLEQCAMAALQAAREARAGALEPRPESCAFQGGCAYPTICRCER
jgi:ATP-dependent helicase/DNAse subunit B